MSDKDRFVYQLVVKGKKKEHVFEVLLTEEEAKDHTDGGMILYKTVAKESRWIRKLREVIKTDS
jgi:hypothetical protein